MIKKKSVGLQILGKNTTGELVALLQVRAEWNAEKNSPESYPGACQVTVHGKLEVGEDFHRALLREVGEELGEEIVAPVQALLDSGKFVELVNDETPEKQVITYGAIVDNNILQKLTGRQKTKSFGGFKIIGSNEIDKIVDIKTINKEAGVTDKNVIAMFPDEKEAVRLAFLKLG